MINYPPPPTPEFNVVLSFKFQFTSKLDSYWCRPWLDVLASFLLIPPLSDRFYCDYCDTYLTHDSVSSLKGCSKILATSSVPVKYPVVPFCFCCSRRWGRRTAAAENTKKMWKTTIRSGWRSRRRASSIKQVNTCLSVCLAAWLTLSLFTWTAVVKTQMKESPFCGWAKCSPRTERDLWDVNADCKLFEVGYIFSFPNSGGVPTGEDHSLAVPWWASSRSVHPHWAH